MFTPRHPDRALSPRSVTPGRECQEVLADPTCVTPSPRPRPRFFRCTCLLQRGQLPARRDALVQADDAGRDRPQLAFS